MKKIIILIIVILIGLGIYFATKSGSDVVVNDGDSMSDVMDDNSMEEGDAMEEEDKTKTVIGSSVDGREITAYHYGSGEKEVLLVGGIHGGYSPNTSILSYEAMAYFETNADTIPEGVKLTIIPALNPDGLMIVTGTSGPFTADDLESTAAERTAARFNSNKVDLNRNFACDWQTDAIWKETPVSGGTSEFSEPEAQALRDYVNSNNPAAVVVYYSAGGGVFAASCHNGVSEETSALTDLYAASSDYKGYQSFNYYEITGDAVNWLAKEGVPAISVLLTNHTDVEWSENKAGIEAVLEYYAE